MILGHLKSQKGKGKKGKKLDLYSGSGSETVFKEKHGVQYRNLSNP
jgi:hypothetical protein